MGCGCGKNKQRFQVQVNGKIVFTTGNAATAAAVARRYPDGVVVEAAMA